MSVNTYGIFCRFWSLNHAYCWTNLTETVYEAGWYTQKKYRLTILISKRSSMLLRWWPFVLTSIKQLLRSWTSFNYILATVEPKSIQFGQYYYECLAWLVFTLYFTNKVGCIEYELVYNKTCKLCVYSQEIRQCIFI